MENNKLRYISHLTSAESLRQLIHNNCKLFLFLSISDIALSSDFIAGFCGETEAAHEEAHFLGYQKVKWPVLISF
jgi:tRNA A37 methylthiotransferase MiaB